MARLSRIDLPFCLYHVFSRTVGINKNDDTAFYDFKDQNKFLEYLEKYTSLFSFRVHAWCLMATHFHLLLESMEQAEISELMRRLLTAYTVYFNRRHGRHGHLFQGRFQSLVVEKASQLLAVSRYVHLNPVNTANPVDAEKYQGSSLRFYLLGGEPSYLYTREILGWFGDDRSKYNKFIKDGLNEETSLPIHARRFIGDKSFADRMRNRLNMAPQTTVPKARDNTMIEVRQKQHAESLIRAVADYFGLSPEEIKSRSHAHGNISKARTLVIFLLKESLPWTLRQIAEYMNLTNISSVTRQIQKINQEHDIRQNLHNIKETLKISNFT
jgi:REP element-mobilizing transposase RayT